jgi:hypothetical protein
MHSAATIARVRSMLPAATSPRRPHRPHGLGHVSKRSLPIPCAPKASTPARTARGAARRWCLLHSTAKPRDNPGSALVKSPAPCAPWGTATATRTAAGMQAVAFASPHIRTRQRSRFAPSRDCVCLRRNERTGTVTKRQCVATLGRPTPHPARMRAAAGLPRRLHSHSRRRRRTALQGPGQQHGRQCDALAWISHRLGRGKQRHRCGADPNRPAR